MRCPWCGRPVTIHGAQWECYWCKDFGTVQKKPAPPPPQTPQITFTVSVVCHFDLPGRFSELKTALHSLAPRQEALSALLGKVLLYTISLANRRKGGLFDEEKTEQLRTFLEEVPDAVPGENADALVRRAGQEVVFAEEGALSKQNCGTFWSMLISLRMPLANDAEDEPESLSDLFLGLCSIYNHFGDFEGWDYEYALRAAFCTQLRKRAMPQPKARLPRSRRGSDKKRGNEQNLPSPGSRSQRTTAAFFRIVWSKQRAYRVPMPTSEAHCSLRSAMLLRFRLGKRTLFGGDMSRQ